MKRVRNRHANENEQQTQERRQLENEQARDRRANENEQQTQGRRQIELERARDRRANENQQQTQERRQVELERARDRRANENEQQTQERRQLENEQARDRRANENEQQTQGRRQIELERARDRRANENQQQTQERRQVELERARDRRANENEQQTQERRQLENEQARDRRANENEQQTQERRQVELERARDRRANENEQQTQERRQVELERARDSRANENEQQTQERRQVELERARDRRANENEQQTQERRQVELEQARDRRANENEQQTQERRQVELERARDRRANENEGQQHRRRNINAQIQRNRRANENIEQGRQRRQANVERNRNIRENENEAQIAHRRRGDNARHRRPRRLNLAHIEQPQYAQLYIIEAAQALDLRMQNPSAVDCNRATMALIQDVLETVNPYAASFKHMKQVEQEEQNRAIAENRPVSRITMVMREGHDQRRGNAPLHEEVAAIFTGEDGAPPAGRNIVVYPRNHHLQSIPSTSSVVDPYIYPLLFPRGDLGWDMNMPHVAERATRTRNHVTQLEHYVYRLAIRRGFSALHLSGRLFQQFLVDAYTKVEGSRLDFLRHNQQQLRAECYQGLVDHLENAAEQRNLNAGHVIVLPSTFSGSPRAMHQLYLDAMAVVSKHGKPDAFLTFTCNPRWREVTENLLPNQKAHDRPDLLTRVFRMKLFAMKKEIMQDGILGMVVARVDVIEFQKRGLPHAHILIHFAAEFKLRNADDIDRLICAQLPDPETEPELYEIIKSNMIHGPCGALNDRSPCMIDGSCSKGFPKSFNDETVMNVDGYPSYHRPDNGRTVRVRNLDLDNRWVVPYCPYLCKKYNAHINLEACVSIKAVKYLYKYIYKGHDTAHIEIAERIDHDEIRTFLDARYVSAPEACWRLFAFPMHTQSHTVIRLAVHLPNFQRVYFREGEEENAADRAGNNETMLTAWFLLNQNDPTARQILYPDIPYDYVFIKSRNGNKWKVRERGHGTVISRMYNAGIREGERYFLRVLLLHVPGATSFEYLRTFDGEVYPTFREACLARGLLADDNIWVETLNEVVHVATPVKIRRTFCTILIHGEPNNPAELWESFKEHMIQDFLRHHSELQAEQMTLSNIANMLHQFGKSLQDFNLPDFDIEIVQEQPNAAANRVEADRVRPSLNEAQTTIADAVINALSNNDFNSAKLFFIDGPGGCGKTYTYNYIIKEARAQSFTVSTSSWTGIAATLLDGGKTCHSLFKLPVPVNDGSTCSVKPNSTHAEFLRNQDIFIFDEASMIPKHALEAVDRMLRDICNSGVPFAGKVVLLGGDFRQTLPVVKRGSPAQVVESCLKRSPLWPLAQVFHLNQNMRTGIGEQEFSNFLLRLGEGALPMKAHEPYLGCIEIPEQCVLPKDSDLIQQIFGNFADGEDLTKRVILTPTNEEALEINERILQRQTGDVCTYFSFDSVVADTQEEVDLYPQEFLNSITPSGMPRHKLNLKVGSVVMLLRNLSLKDGLCNGTRLKIHVNKFHHYPSLTGEPSMRSPFHMGDKPLQMVCFWNSSATEPRCSLTQAV
ncbi:uncharacterized protein [Clytia hemisphaerica]|uniref:uncharacterized protein n=1 Tax=Clytia hemisphaerica TaxID=252671 RepID=UPI0034D3B6B5